MTRTAQTTQIPIARHSLTAPIDVGFDLHDQVLTGIRGIDFIAPGDALLDEIEGTIQSIRRDYLELPFSLVNRTAYVLDAECRLGLEICPHGSECVQGHGYPLISFVFITHEFESVEAPWRGEKLVGYPTTEVFPFANPDHTTPLCSTTLADPNTGEPLLSLSSYDGRDVVVLDELGVLRHQGPVSSVDAAWLLKNVLAVQTVIRLSREGLLSPIAR